MADSRCFRCTRARGDGGGGCRCRSLLCGGRVRCRSMFPRCSRRPRGLAESQLLVLFASACGGGPRGSGHVCYLTAAAKGTANSGFDWCRCARSLMQRTLSLLRMAGTVHSGIYRGRCSRAERGGHVDWLNVDGWIGVQYWWRSARDL